MPKEEVKVIRSNGEFTVPAGHQVYELNLETGLILLAALTKKQDSYYYTIEEKELCVYLPARDKEHAKREFNSALRQARKPQQNDKRNNSKTGIQQAGKDQSANLN